MVAFNSVDRILSLSPHVFSESYCLRGIQSLTISNQDYL